MKIYQIFYLKICCFLVVKFSIYLNRSVFVMRRYVFWCCDCLLRLMIIVIVMTIPLPVLLIKHKYT